MEALESQRERLLHQFNHSPRVIGSEELGVLQTEPRHIQDNDDAGYLGFRLADYLLQRQHVDAKNVVYCYLRRIEVIWNVIQSVLVPCRIFRIISVSRSGSSHSVFYDRYLVFARWQVQKAGPCAQLPTCKLVTNALIGRNE